MIVLGTHHKQRRIVTQRIERHVITVMICRILDRNFITSECWTHRQLAFSMKSGGRVHVFEESMGC